MDAFRVTDSPTVSGLQAASYASLGVASLYSINSSAFCYNNGYGNVGCYNVGNNNIGDNNFGDYNMGSYNNGSFNNGTGNLVSMSYFLFLIPYSTGR